MAVTGSPGATPSFRSPSEVGLALREWGSAVVFWTNAPLSRSGLSRPYLLGEGARGAVSPSWAAQEADVTRERSGCVRRRVESAPPRAVTELRTRRPRGQSRPVVPSDVPYIEVLALSLTTPSRTPSGEGVVRERPIRPAQGSLTTTLDRSVFAAGPSAEQVSRPSSEAHSLTDTWR